MIQEQDTAKKIIEALDYGIVHLDASTAERLTDARKHAISSMATPAHGANAETVLASAGRFIVDHIYNHRMWGAVLLLLATILTFLSLQHNYINPPVEGDAWLLASELPPEAYVDKGFDAWLEHSSQL
jgi:Protein of unknown function (DUF3619)